MKKSRKCADAASSLLVPGVGERNSTTWNAVAFQQQLMGHFSLSQSTAACGRSRRRPGQPGVKMAASREAPKAAGTSGKRERWKEVEPQEYVLGPKPKPLTLAQKLGLIDHPAAPLTDSQWQSAKAKSNARNDSSLPCVICKEPFAYQQQVLLSCSHVFHHACLSAFERFTGKKTCPLCRQKDYETRVIHEASKLHRVQCATTIQSAWRGHRVRTWYNEMRRTVVPRDPKLRRKFYEDKFVEANNRFVREVEETETAARNLIRDIDENLAYSRRISQLLNRRLIETTVDWKAVRATAAARNITECPICIVPLDISLTNETTKEYPHGHMSIQTTTSEHLRDAVDGERCHRKTVLLSCCHAFHEPCFDTFEQLCSGSFDLVCPVCRSLYSKLTIEQ